MEGAKTAILVLAAKPGVQEDEVGRAFVGESGQYIHNVYVKWIEAHTSKPFDVFVNNAVRCRPPRNNDPTTKELEACSAYLDSDLVALAKSYDRVVVLACGAEACRMVFGGTLGDGLRHQCTKIDHGAVAFATMNPAALLPGRDPSLVVAVRYHLDMVADFIEHGYIPMTTRVPDPGPPICELPGEPAMLAIDVETYGCIEGMPRQTVFHPRKMVAADGIETRDIIVSAACAWQDTHGNFHTAVYKCPSEWRQFALLLRDAIGRGIPILGQNLAFDLMCIRAYDPDTQLYLNRDEAILRELSIANFLNCDVRPERSLKELAPLLRVVSYDEEVDLKSGDRYPSREDPRLLRYNALDCVATLDCWNRLVANTLRGYPKTDRFSDESLRWFSDVLWTVVQMDEIGVAFDEPALKALADQLERKKTRLSRRAEARWGYKLAGKGSKKHLQTIVDKAVESARLGGDKRLEITKKTRLVSTGRANLNLLLGKLPIDHPDRGPVVLLSGHKKASKVVSSYTDILLKVPKKKHGKVKYGKLIGGIAYPTWYPVPSTGDGGDSGGTKQGRITCSAPALQTLPKSVKACMSSRFSPGVLIGADYSQIELRVAALLSGDEGMMQAYRDNRDIHAETAKVLFGDGATALPHWSSLRQVGKTVNFLMLFWGGPKKLQETLRRDNGMELPLLECGQMVTRFSAVRQQLRRWQASMVDMAKRQGYIELPYTGEARLFVGHKAVVDETYVPTIVNFPVQTTAANIMKSAQRVVMDQLAERGMQAQVVLNIYDALYVDAPASEEQAVFQVLKDVLPCPPFYSMLQSSIGRQLPIGYEAKVLART